MNSNTWWVRQKRTPVAASIIRLPNEIVAGLKPLRDWLLRQHDDDGQSAEVVQAAIDWFHFARKPSVRVSFDFDPAPVGTTSTKPSEKELRDAEAFQAPNE